MHELPAREKLDIASMVAQYLVVASALDKASAPEDYDHANELSLQLAMILPAPIYAAMAEAATHPNGKIHPAAVAVMVRQALFPAGADGDLRVEQIAFHTPGVAPRPTPSGKAH